MEEIEIYLQEAQEGMQKALSHTSTELSKIRAGKVLPNVLDGLKVDYYGSMTPIAQVATVNNLDARTLVIKPWERSMIVHIEKAIKNSDLGVTPQNDGEQVRLNFPALTEEKRQGLVKQAKNEAENGRIRIRNIRKDVNDGLKGLLKDGASEDAIKSAEAKVQDHTNNFIKKVDELLALKEQDILKV